MISNNETQGIPNCDAIKSYDEAKESYSSYSKVLEFQNIPQINEQNNFASFYALNKLNNRIEDRASLRTNNSSIHIRQKYKKQKWLRAGLYYLYLFITIFQRPSWCNFDDYQDYCQVRDDYRIPTMVNFYLPLNLFYCLEICIVLFLSLSKIVKASTIGNQQRKQIAKLLIIVVFLLIVNDIIVMITENNYAYNVSLLLKPFFLVLYKHSLQAIIFHYCSIIQRSKEIYYLMAFSLLFFAGIGVAIFYQNDTQNSNQICQIDQPPFSQPQKCIIIILFILQTTVNSPDIYLPYYEEYRPYIAYFISFQFINTLLIINLVLAFFYSSYRNLMQEKTEQYLSTYNQNMSKYARQFLRQRTVSEINSIADIDELKNEVSISIYKILDNKIYETIIEIICLCSFLSVFISQSTTKLYILLTLNSFLFIETVALLFFAGTNIMNKKHLLFELFINTSILGLIIINLTNQVCYRILSGLLCYRLIRGCKWLLQYDNFTYLIISLVQISNYVLQLFGPLLILFMVFTGLGELLFGGTINYSNETTNHYELANFNDFLSGMCTCWFLLIINNWNVIAYNYAQILNSDLVYIYFISFYIIVVLFSLNVTMALLIDYLVTKLNYKIRESSPDDEIDVNQKRLIE